MLAPSLVKALSARPKTVARASDALFLLIELDAAEATLVSRHPACFFSVAALNHSAGGGSEGAWQQGAKERSGVR